MPPKRPLTPTRDAPLKIRHTNKVRPHRALRRRHHPPRAKLVPPPPLNTPSSSSFLTVLPPEVRERIYHHVFVGRELHIREVQQRGRGVVLGCEEWDPEDVAAGTRWHEGWGEGERRGRRVVGGRTKGGLCGLLLSCRLVYEESLKFLHALPAFTAWEPEAVIRFTSILGGSRTSWLSVLRLDFQFAEPVIVGGVFVPAGARDRGGGVDWDATCASLGLMRGLQMLEVVIYPYDALAERNGASGMVWGMLGALRGVRASVFRVGIRERFMEFADMLGAAPFVLVQAKEFIYVPETWSGGMIAV